MSKIEVSDETLVRMLLMTMPNDVAPSIILSLANIAVQIAKGNIPADEVPKDKWELTLTVIKGVAEKSILEKLSKKAAGDAIKKAAEQS